MSRSRRGTTSASTSAPEEQFGQDDAIPDELLPSTGGRSSPSSRCRTADPMECEARAGAASSCAARTGTTAAVPAEAHFTRVVREGGAPEEVPEHALPAGDPVHLPAVIAAAFGLSTSEARRLIAQGGVKLDGEPRRRARPCRATTSTGKLLQAGKRRFARLVALGLTPQAALLHSFGRPQGRQWKALRLEERLRSIRIRPFS